MVDRALLNKATSADDTPTPGYMFGEIAKATFADIDACQQLADYLIKKLERDNPHVKLKVLRIIRHVCDQGKHDFRRAIQKKADLVKQCQQYRGTPDPLKGDAPNKAVREEADVALKSIFSSDSSTDAFGRSIDQGRKMTGFGSDAAGGGGGGGGNMGGNSFGGGGGSFGGNSFGGGGGNSAYGGGGGMGGGGGGGGGVRRMEGFGNPNFDNGPPPGGQDTGAGAQSAVKDTFNNAVSAISKWTSKAYGGNAGGPPSLEESTGAYRAPNMNDMNQSSYGGGGGGGGGGGFGSGVQGRWGDPQPPSAAPRTAASATVGDYEARVVGELCAPGGARVAPSPQVLEEFCRKCESLDAAAVGDQLRQKLHSAEWQTRLKALHAVEALHNNSMDGIVGHIVEHASDLLFEAQDIPQCRQKATKVLHLLGFIDQADDGGAAGRKPSSRPAPASQTMDLLDMDGDGPPAPQATAAASGNAGDDLLGGGGLLGEAPQAYAPPDNAGSSQAGGGMLDLGLMSEPAPAAAYAPPMPPQDQGGLLGAPSPGMQGEQPSLLAALQGGGSQPTPAAPQQQPAGGQSSLLGDLQMGGSSAAGPCQGLSMPPADAFQPPVQQPPAMDAQRGSHLNILSGGGNSMPMGGGCGGGGMGMQMGGGMMQPGMQGMGAMGMPQQQPQYGQFPPGSMGMAGGPMMNQPCNQGGMMAPQMQQSPMMMQQPQMPMQQQQMPMQQQQMPQMFQQQAGMQQQFQQQPAMPSQMPMSSMSSGGPSAFSFVGGAAPSPQGNMQMGGCGGCPAMGSGLSSGGNQGFGGPGSGPRIGGDNNNNAFSFVADEMRRS